ncbi:MAG: hypothetical protein FWE09_08260 [Treponema sp.]|nr:hypothetical protein [Treponema sp.]
MAAAFPPSLILPAPGRSIYSGLRLLDGTALSEKDAMALLGTLPENYELVRQVKNGRAWSWSLFGVFGAALITATVFRLSALPSGTNDIGVPIALTVSGVSLISIELISAVTGKRFLKALDNYNLHLLGIPVAGRN